MSEEKIKGRLCKSCTPPVKSKLTVGYENPQGQKKEVNIESSNDLEFWGLVIAAIIIAWSIFNDLMKKAKKNVPYDNTGILTSYIERFPYIKPNDSKYCLPPSSKIRQLN